MIKSPMKIKSLAGLVKQATQLFGGLLKISSKASKQASSDLFGVIGGLIGLALAYGLHIIHPEYPIAVTGIIFTVIGIPIGTLMYRGRGFWGFENRLEMNQIAANEILNRIKALPASAPPDVSDALWQTYKSLNQPNSVGVEIKSTQNSNTKYVEITQPQQARISANPSYLDEKNEESPS